MANIIDLSVLVQEPLIFKMPKCEDVFEIPGEISTEFTIKMFKYSQDMEKLKDEIEALDKLKQMVLDILSLDESKEIDMTYIDKNLKDLRYLKLIVSKMMEHIREISQDPNFNSPKLEDK
ncbi:hypothetical protein [Brassicibacter mesophilus]|uniref:hypothetical protein n=1 Tax=Brassicibacter mesophilus TaxID=745119 RepID=UPI003D2359D1